MIFRERSQTCFLSPASSHLVVGELQHADLAGGISMLETRGGNVFLVFNWKNS